jgi:hypothetical protein
MVFKARVELTLVGYEIFLVDAPKYPISKQRSPVWAKLAAGLGFGESGVAATETVLLNNALASIEKFRVALPSLPHFIPAP